MSCVTYHMSSDMCHISHVTCHLSRVMCHRLDSLNKMMELFGGGSVINMAYPVQSRAPAAYLAIYLVF